MKKILLVILVVILTFAVPYGVMQYNGSFTLKSYGNILCYVGMVHILLGLMGFYHGPLTNNKDKTRIMIFNDSPYDYFDKTDYKERYYTMTSIVISLFLVMLGIATIYVGYLLFQ